MGDNASHRGKHAAHKVVKLFGGQAYERSRFSDQVNWVRRYNMKQAMAASSNVPIVQMTSPWRWLASSTSPPCSPPLIKPPLAVTFIAAMLMLTAPIKRLTGVSEHLQRGLAASESVFDRAG